MRRNKEEPSRHHSRRFALVKLSRDKWLPLTLAHWIPSTTAAIDKINGQNLSWTAGLTPHNLGKRVRDFATGVVPLSAQQRTLILSRILSHDAPDSNHTVLTAEDRDPQPFAWPAPAPPAPLLLALQPQPDAAAAASLRGGGVRVPMVVGGGQLAPPPSYDARDTYPGQLRCDAFAPLDQHDCDSCYAFGVVTAYSARLCVRDRSSLGNVVISPQQLIDCNGGCGGNDELSTFESLVRRPPVETWWARII
jgi:hypothetical protein